MKNKWVLLLGLFTILICLNSNSQDRHKLDSLWNAFNNSKHDTIKVEILSEKISSEYHFYSIDSAVIFYNRAIKIIDKNLIISKEDIWLNNKFTLQKAKTLRYIGNVNLIWGYYDEAKKYYQQAIEINKELSRNCRDKLIINEAITGLSSCYSNLGIICSDQGLYEKALEYYKKALKVNEISKDQNMISTCYINIGIVHDELGHYDTALDYYFKALRIYEEIGEEKRMSNCYSNIGVIYKNQASYDLAIDYHEKALKINNELGDLRGMASSYNNIGNVYFSQSDNSKALEYYMKALKTFEEIVDKNGLSATYANIGNAYYAEGSYNKVSEYYMKALKLKEELGDQFGIAILYDNFASLNISLTDSAALSENQRLMYINRAIEYGLKSFNLSKEIKALPMVNNSALSLLKAYKKLGDFKNALKYIDIYISTKDSLFNQEKTKALAEMGTKYESEKKQLEIEKMQKQKELDNKTIETQQTENRKQLIIIIASIFGLLIVIVFSIIMLRMLRQKRKDNKLLAEQKEEIEEKNKDILDSIKYAKRIQSAILPQDKVVKEYLTDSFILYKPKDIVAGDFYWMEHKDKKILFAVADCTGHGVPGAMVSVVCNNGLNRSVREHGLTDPGKILDNTKEIVIQEFEKSEEEVKDGMDIALCSLDGDKLQYAGAHNPLWIIRNGELFEYKADNQPIGVSRISHPFTTHTFELQNGDTLYIFSDGYVDQFGGENAKKYKSKAFKELLVSIQDRSMEEQRKLLDENFESWRGKLEQIDDVCVIGVRISL